MEIDSSHAMTISSRPVGRFSNPGGPIKSISPVFKISLYETPLSGIITCTEMTVEQKFKNNKQHMHFFVTTNRNTS